MRLTIALFLGSALASLLVFAPRSAESAIYTSPHAGCFETELSADSHVWICPFQGGTHLTSGVPGAYFDFSVAVPPNTPTTVYMGIEKHAYTGFFTYDSTQGNYLTGNKDVWLATPNTGSSVSQYDYWLGYIRMDPHAGSPYGIALKTN